MEACITAVVGPVIEVFTGRFLTYSGRFLTYSRRQIGYVVHYKKNMEDLDSKVEALREVRESIQEKVHTAEDNAEAIKEDVSDWLTKVSKKVGDLDGLAERGNIKSCFHVCSRYRLSKESKELLCDVPQLIERGGEFVTVAPPASWYTALTNFEPFQSRESVFKKFIEVLRDDRNSRIGIYGMGGIGKTRMAEEIAKQAKKEKLFDEVVKVVFTQVPDLENIQKELASYLKLSFSAENKIGRKVELCNRLKNGKKFLVIIDDIWDDKVKLEEIGIPSNDYKDCKVLLTSRREDVLIKMEVQKNLRIENLQENEAWELFKKTVGDFIESHSEINSVAKQVCRKCGNLPLAILVVGAAMRNKKENYAWNYALNQLRNCRGDNIEGVNQLFSCITLSYEFLPLDLQLCFLYCSLFPEDAEIPIDDLVMYGVATRFLKDDSHQLNAARDTTLEFVDTLKKSNLLLEGRNNNLVKMHDVIRDVAISIASNKGFRVKTDVPKWPDKYDEYESHRVISVRSKDIKELPCELECPELCTLVLECNYNSKPQVPDSFFKGSEKLQVLELRFVRLPSSPLNLVHLRMLRLYYCEKINLVFLKELRNLEILSIADYDLKEVVVEVGQLTSLRWLDLSKCKKLEIIPSGVIKSLSNIEELYFPFEFKGWGNEGNARLDELNSLTRLTTLHIHIGYELELPNELLCSELLNRFKISIGSTSFNTWDENVGARMLKLDFITLRKEFTILMAKADVLVLERMEGLKNVLHSGDGKGFLDLNNLKIRGCNDMEHLLGRPNGNLQTQGSFSKLSVLVVENCTMKFLLFPSMARALLQLQKLDISHCKIMEEIILDDEKVMDKVIFHQLKKMTLWSLPILRSICGNMKKMSTTECSTSALAQALFNEKVSFPALEELYIIELKSVTTIWDNQLLVSTSFQQLTSLTIDSCHSLRNVFSPSIAKNLRQLQKLTVIHCEKIEDIIAFETVQGEEEVTDDEIIVFPQLKEMELKWLPNLKSFWSGFEKAAGKNDIPQVQALFNHKVKFPSLEEFEYRWNENNLKEIWSSTVPIDAFCKLRKLRVKDCDKLLSIAPPSKLLQNLEELYIEGCPNLEKGLETTGVEKVSTSFQQLTTLNIDSCHSLRNVFSPSIAKNLRQLQELKVWNCKKIEEIIAVETEQGEEEVADDEIIVFPQLKKMELYELPNLKSFWSSTCGSNKEAVDDDIPQVHALFNYKVKFPSLEEFSCKRSKNNLKEIWNTTVPIDYFCKLRRLTLYDCDELLSVAPSKLLGSFHNLEELYIWMCPSLEEIFKVEGKSNNAEEGIVVARDKDIEEDLETISKLPSLVKMEITNCPKLKSAALYTSKKKAVFPILETLRLSDESIFEDIWYGHVPTGSFSKVRELTMDECSKLVNASTLLQRFEVVEELTVYNCSSLEVVFNLEGLEDIERGRITKLELLAFHNLRSLTVISCNSLKYLFSLSMARNLTEIEHLNVGWCDAIEEVIRNEDQGEEDGVMDEIVFPKLQSIELVYLANLTSFCGTNNAFKLPSLTEVRLRDCCKIQTFTSGRISTQLITLVDGNGRQTVSDLNKYVEQCVQKRKGRDVEETSLANEIKDDEETS